MAALQTRTDMDRPPDTDAELLPRSVHVIRSSSAQEVRRTWSGGCPRLGASPSLVKRGGRHEHCLGTSGARAAIGYARLGRDGGSGRRRQCTAAAHRVDGRVGCLRRTRRRRDRGMGRRCTRLRSSCCRGFRPHRGRSRTRQRVAVAATSPLGQIEKPDISGVGHGSSCRYLSRPGFSVPYR
jgi:hypothetical protein